MREYVQGVEAMKQLKSDFVIGFIGFGLIGGSIARSLKQCIPSLTMIGYNYNKEKPNKNLLAAQADGIIDTICTELETDFYSCDIIFLCAPVLKNIDYLSKLKGHIKPSCILTDVGSVKGNIHEAINKLQLDSQFIGGHPMAGSEKTGYQSSSATLLQNAFYVLTPTSSTPSFMVDTMIEVIEVLNAIPIMLDATHHDNVAAAISHVPHIIASELTNMVKNNDDENEMMRRLMAGGFKDTTRIASSSPEMWQNICLTNTDSIIHFLRIYKQQIEKTLEALENKDGEYLNQLFSSAKEYRDSIIEHK